VKAEAVRRAQADAAARREAFLGDPVQLEAAE
jgi:hypothetical protein